MTKTLRGLLVAWTTATTLSAAAAIDNYQPQYRLIDNQSYPTLDLAVATANVLDYGIDNTGNRDCTADLQALLDKVAGVGGRSNNRGDYRNICGGTVYMPAGTYRFTGHLVIPVGVTLRGDWKNPGNGSRVEGTVIKIEPSDWDNYDKEEGFINMQPCTQLEGLTFWYPGQSASNPRQTCPTVVLGQKNYWGNEYCTVRHCNFINSYTAVIFDQYNGGGCPNIFDIYGSPLKYGVVMDNISDVGRFDGVHFSPDYWVNSGLSGAPSRSELSNWLYNNAVGISMQRNDWSYTCNYSADSYMIGFLCEDSWVDPNHYPNGHNYNFNLTNCRTGLQFDQVSYCGVMFTKITTSGCAVGVRINHSGSGPVQLLGCSFNDATAIEIDENSNSEIMLQECNVRGKTNVRSGHFQSVNSTYGADVTIASGARTIFCGNKMTGSARFINNSLFRCQVSDTHVNVTPLPDFSEEWMQQPVTQPARKALYVVTGITPYGIEDNINSMSDCTAAIQNKLNEAAAAGGGIVYLPPGHYRMNGNLTIPSGVELKGASDLPNVPHGHGSIFEVTAGRGNASVTPFIQMGVGSGIRGIVINYPDQNNSLNCVPYPYAIRANKDCYVVNVSMRAAYNGLDLFTNKCDNHYVDYLGGHAFANVLRVGGNSANGIISNIQFNTIAYARGDETKFGRWPNSVADRALGDNVAYQQNERDLDFFIIGDSSDLVLYNNFLFGCNKGMHFIADSNGGARNCHSVGNAVDGAVNTFVFEGIGTDLDLINSQVVAIHPNTPELVCRFITSSGSGMNGRKVSFLSSDLWGSGEYFCDTRNGTVELSLAHADQSGRDYTFDIASGASVDVANSIFDNTRKWTASAAATGRLNVTTSTFDATGSDANAMGKNLYNLTKTWEMREFNDDEFLNRDGWLATAFNNTTGTGNPTKEGPNTRSALDGDTATRWDSQGSQTPGQWFNVNFNRNETFNTLLLDATASGANDGPAAYKVEVYTNGRWQTVAEGSNGAGMLIVEFPTVTASQIRVTQTGSKSNYWSIHEFNLANFDDSSEPDPGTGGHDLVASKIFWTPGKAEIQAGEKIHTFKVVVTNESDIEFEPGNEFTVTLSHNGTTVGSPVTVRSGIAPNGSVTLDIPGEITTEAGAHTVKASVSHTAGELSHDNNTRERTYNAIGNSSPVYPDNFIETGYTNSGIVISKVAWYKVTGSTQTIQGKAVPTYSTTEPIKPGDKVVFVGTLTNLGTSATGNVKHGFVIETQPGWDPKYWSDYHYQSIAPGQSVDVVTCGGTNNNGGLWTAVKGNSTFSAKIDSFADQGSIVGATYLPQFTVEIADGSAVAEPDYHEFPTGADDPQETGVIGLTEIAPFTEIWYTIGGIRIDRPTEPGIYIRNGRKVIVR